MDRLAHWPAGQNVLSVPGVARLLELHPCTVWNWIRHGVKDVNGRQVKLEATRAGRRWRIDRAGLLAFLCACEGKPVPGPAPLTPAGRDAEELQRLALARLRGKSPLAR